MAAPKIRYTHDGLIDMVIAEPMVSQNELAARFGFTPSWISIIMTSDAFKAKLEMRRAEVVDPVLRASLEDRFRAVTQRSLEVLLDKLHQPSSLVPDQLALQAASLGAKSLGMGQPKPQGEVAASNLDQLADRLIALQRGFAGTTTRKPETVDVEYSQVPAEAGVNSTVVASPLAA